MPDDSIPSLEPQVVTPEAQGYWQRTLWPTIRESFFGGGKGSIPGLADIMGYQRPQWMLPRPGEVSFQTMSGGISPLDIATAVPSVGVRVTAAAAAKRAAETAERASEDIAKTSFQRVLGHKVSRETQAALLRDTLPKELQHKDDATQINNGIGFLRRSLVRAAKAALKQPWAKDAKNQYKGYNIIAHRYADEFGYAPERVMGGESGFSPNTSPEQSHEAARRAMKMMTQNSGYRFDADMENYARNATWKNEKGAVAPLYLPEEIEYLKGKRFSDLPDNSSTQRSLLQAKWMRAFDEVHHTDRTLRMIRSDGSLGDFVRSSLGNPMPFAWTTWDHMQNGIDALQGSRPLNEILSSPKVANYYMSKLLAFKNSNHVVVDTHHGSLSFGNSLPSSSDLIKKVFPAGRGGPNKEFGGLYSIVHEATIQAAKELGMNPKELQALVWSYQRGYKSPDAFGRSLIGKAARKAVNQLWIDASEGKLTERQAHAGTEQIARKFHRGRIPEPAYFGKRSSGGPPAVLGTPANTGELPASSGLSGGAGPRIGSDVSAGIQDYQQGGEVTDQPPSWEQTTEVPPAWEETTAIGGHRVRVEAYGPIENEYHHAANYGPNGNRLYPFDVALSPDLLEHYPLGSWIKVAGADRRVADVSYRAPGVPNRNTVEIRDMHDQGYGTIMPSEFRTALASEVADQRRLIAGPPTAAALAPRWEETTAEGEPTPPPKPPITPDPNPAKNAGDWLHKTFGGFHLATDEEYRERLATPKDIEHVKYAAALAQKPLPGVKSALHWSINHDPAIMGMRAIAKQFPNTDLSKTLEGTLEGVEDIGTAMSSPANLTLLATGIGESSFVIRGISTAFFGMAASRFPTELKQFNATKDPAVKARLLTEMAAGLGLPLLGFKGAKTLGTEDLGAFRGYLLPREGEPTVGPEPTEPTEATGEAATRNQNVSAGGVDIRSAADRHKDLINEGQHLSAQAQLMRKMGQPVPSTISDRIQAINAELRDGVHVEDTLPVRDEQTGATTKPKDPSAFAPVDPPNTSPEVGKVSRALKNFRNWWERFWPRDWAVLRNQPDSWTITEHQRLLQARQDYMHNFTRMPWFKGLRKLGSDGIVDGEARAVTRYRQLKEQGVSSADAWEQAVSEAPPELAEYFRYRQARQAAEDSAADDLEVPRPDRVEDPYLPRITNKDMSDIVQLHPKFSSWTRQIREGIGSFDKSRVHPTMQEGISKGAEYEDPIKAIFRREEFSVSLEATANLLRNLKDKGTLFDTFDEARAANPGNRGGAPMKLTGLGGRDYWVRSRQEGIALEQNLSPRGTSGSLGRLTHMVNLFSRDPNFTNPLPHITKNMAFKYILARITSPIFRRDAAEYAGNATMRQRFENVMPFARHGQRIDQLRAWEAGNWTQKAAALPGKVLSYSHKLIFEKADPAMRYALWKSYVRKGMTDIEAANNVWLDLIRYDANSGGLNFWRSIPFNFFATWRTGSFVTLAKAAYRAPIRTALFIGAVDYMREAIYRQTGLWTHLPHDYLEAPLMEMITGGPRKAAGVAATTFLFGPGGGQAPATISQYMQAIQGDPEQRARAMNMFWGLSFLGNTPAEMKQFRQDGDISHLGRILANFAFGTHAALKYEPRRMAKYLPEWMPLMEKSATVREAEQLRGVIEQRQKKGQATYERRHGVGATFEYTPEQQQIEALRRAAGQRGGGRRLTRPRRQRIQVAQPP